MKEGQGLTLTLTLWDQDCVVTVDELSKLPLPKLCKLYTVSTAALYVAIQPAVLLPAPNTLLPTARDTSAHCCNAVWVPLLQQATDLACVLSYVMPCVFLD